MNNWNEIKDYKENESFESQSHLFPTVGKYILVTGGSIVGIQLTKMSLVYDSPVIYSLYGNELNGIWWSYVDFNSLPDEVYNNIEFSIKEYNNRLLNNNDIEKEMGLNFL